MGDRGRLGGRRAFPGAARHAWGRLAVLVGICCTYQCAAVRHHGPLQAPESGPLSPDAPAPAPAQSDPPAPAPGPAAHSDPGAPAPAPAHADIHTPGPPAPAESDPQAVPAPAPPHAEQPATALAPSGVHRHAAPGSAETDHPAPGPAPAEPHGPGPGSVDPHHGTTPSPRPAKKVKHVHLRITALNVSDTALARDPALRGTIEGELAAALAPLAGPGISAKDVQVSLEPKPHLVEASVRVFPPQGVEDDAVVAALARHAEEVKECVLSALRRLEGPEDETSGALMVQVGAPQIVGLLTGGHTHAAFFCAYGGLATLVAVAALALTAYLCLRHHAPAEASLLPPPSAEEEEAVFWRPTFNARQEGQVYGFATDTEAREVRGSLQETASRPL